MACSQDESKTTHEDPVRRLRPHRRSGVVYIAANPGGGQHLYELLRSLGEDQTKKWGELLASPLHGGGDRKKSRTFQMGLNQRLQNSFTCWTCRNIPVTLFTCLFFHRRRSFGRINTDIVNMDYCCIRVGPIKAEDGRLDKMCGCRWR